ncbi:MAG: hypothetical protein KJZ93_14450 [Caldilineaceae bacterium]|mgnify:CR=1 FL=1|nr:hypothetical protein [Caldilineaceae bacterium]
MQAQQPQRADRKPGAGDPLRQESQPSLSPTLSLWQIFHNPETFQRTLFARLTLAQRAQAGLIRPLRPPVEPEGPEGTGPEPAALHGVTQDRMHQRDDVACAAVLSRGRRLGREQITANHHDFSSRLRER